MKKRLIVGCEFSGIVRDQFIQHGWDAWSCDIIPSTTPGPHIIGDIFTVLKMTEPWDRAIFHPPCTYLCSSGLHRNKNNPERQAKTEAALEFVRRLLDLPITEIALENPTGCIGTRIRPASQWIQPYEFGEDASKNTGLWLKGLPPLTIDDAWRCPGRKVEWPVGSGKIVERWSNQTDSGQNRLGPSKVKEQRGMDRAITYLKIAEQMALQWA
jgi:hypothetical protein